MLDIRQGDILKIENIRHPILIVSKDYFNISGEVIGCPIFTDSIEGPLHIKISTEEIDGFVQCEKLKLLDVKVRGYSVVDRVNMTDKINVVDAIQGIFDYI